MRKRSEHEVRGYIEWDSARESAGKREHDRARVEHLFDDEIRRRVGELIARAFEDVNKRTR